MDSVDGQADHTLPAHVRADLDDLRQALVQGRDVVARNLLSYLDAEVLPSLGAPNRSSLEHHLAVMTEQLQLPRTRRFKQPATTPSRRRAAAGFRCAFCRQRWGWDAAIRLPGDRGYACTSCAKTVMCPSCGRRKQDNYPTCYRCSGASSIPSRPHGFHSQARQIVASGTAGRVPPTGGVRLSGNAARAEPRTTHPARSATPEARPRPAERPSGSR